VDNLTHSLVGALLGQAGLKRRTGLAMPALILGANLPDVDGVCMVFGTESLAMRRGLTHGPVAWLVLPLLLAAILWGFDRWQAKRGKRPEARLPVRFGWLCALAFVACLTHPALDWLNSYGIRLLEPFSHRWFYGDALFIIDVWLWLGLGFATWLSLRREKRGGAWWTPARVALAAAVGYIGLNISLGPLVFDRPRVLIANPVPFAFWQRQLIAGDGDGHWSIDGTDYGDVSLSRCRLAEAASGDRRARAFLFWSRAPFVERAPDGGWLLRDARFAGVAGARFSVALPASTCRP